MSPASPIALGALAVDILPEDFLDILESSDDEDADLEHRLEELIYTLDRFARARRREA